MLIRSRYPGTEAAEGIAFKGRYHRILRIVRTLDVCVILPVYNEARWIGSCLDSLVSQTRRPAKIYVLDDGSVDRTADIAAGYPGVTVLRNKHLHRPGQLKLAMDLPLAEISHLAEADAFYDPEFLEKTCALIEAGQADMCHGRIYTRNPGKMLPRVVEFYRRRRWGEETKETQTGWVFRTEALRRIKIPTDIFIAEDQVIGAQIRALGYRTRYVPEAKFHHYEKESFRELIRQQFRWGVGSLPLMIRYGGMLHQKNIRDRWIQVALGYGSLCFMVLAGIYWPILLVFTLLLGFVGLVVRGIHLSLQGSDHLAGFLFIFYRILCIIVGFFGFNYALLLRLARRDLLVHT